MITSQSSQYTTNILGPNFNLSHLAFNSIAQKIVGKFVIDYKKVDCHKIGGVDFVINRSCYWMSVLISKMVMTIDLQSVATEGF
jgi:hypothetical protein